MLGQPITLKNSDNVLRFLSICFKSLVGRPPTYTELKNLKQIASTEVEIQQLIDYCRNISKAPPKTRHSVFHLQSKKDVKILVLSTFPTSDPKHGGQIRVHNLIKTYREVSSEVFSAGVLGSPSYAPTPGFVKFPSNNDLETYIENTFLMEDWAIGYAFEHRQDLYQKLVDQIPFSPTFIHVEHPWLFGFAERYRDEFCGGKPNIIYGSANVEHRLKQSILSNHFDQSWTSRASSLVRETEIRAIQGSDLLCCVSKEEEEWFRSLTTQTCLIVPNGATKITSDENAVVDVFRLTEGKKYALFCGSGHPPNATGFWDYFSNGLGCFSPDELLLVVGGVGHALASDERRTRTPGFESRVRITYEVEQYVLEALISGAHTIVLPISYGSGTNLKTAEAILSEKHIVATPTAMRGFEDYVGCSGVSVTDIPEDFLKFIRASMQAPPLEVSVDDRMSRQKLSWDQSLSALRSFFSDPQRHV